MDREERTQLLHDLAESLARRQLLAPARLLLDVIDPFSFLASQVALFIQPLTPRGRWYSYVRALDDEQGWQLLHEIVERRDC